MGEESQCRGYAWAEEDMGCGTVAEETAHTHGSATLLHNGVQDIL